MMEQGIAVAKLVVAVAFNAVGLVALLAGAWLMPQLLQILVGVGWTLG